MQRQEELPPVYQSPPCPAGGPGPRVHLFTPPGVGFCCPWFTAGKTLPPWPSLLSGLKQPLALSSPIPRPFRQLLGPICLSLRPRQELPACLGLTPGPLTPALALADKQALLNLQHYLLSWGDLCPGEQEK